MSKPVLSVVERLPDAVANREVVELLEAFLRDAKSGKIVSVAIAGVSDTRELRTAASHQETGLLLAALSRISHRINAGLDSLE